QALLRSGDKPAGATVLARYLKKAPPDAGDRAEATRTLDGLSRALLRIDIDASGFETVLVDDRRVDPGPVYVLPGRHTAEAHAGPWIAGAEVSGRGGEIVPATLVLAPAPAIPERPSDSRPASGGTSGAPASVIPERPSDGRPGFAGTSGAP